jgi:polar amino acid transport system substrate-binding protein
MLQRVLVYLLSSLCLCAQADNLRLVTGDDYAPFTGQALPGGGMLTQVVAAVLSERGLTHSLDWRPWNRGYLRTLQGEYDATYPYVRTPQREREYLYSAALFLANQHIFSRAAEPIELDDPGSLQGLRFCYPLGWEPPRVLQALLDQGLLTRHSPIGLKECARLLLLGRDDFFISDRHLGETALQLTGADPSRFRRSVSAINNSTLHLIVPRNHPQGAWLIEQFDLGLRTLQGSGHYQQLLDSYLQARDAALTEQPQ